MIFTKTVRITCIRICCSLPGAVGSCMVRALVPGSSCSGSIPWGGRRCVVLLGHGKTLLYPHSAWTTGSLIQNSWIDALGHPGTSTKLQTVHNFIWPARRLLFPLSSRSFFLCEEPLDLAGYFIRAQWYYSYTFFSDPSCYFGKCTLRGRSSSVGVDHPYPSMLSLFNKKLWSWLYSLVLLQLNYNLAMKNNRSSGCQTIERILQNVYSIPRSLPLCFSVYVLIEKDHIENWKQTLLTTACTSDNKRSILMLLKQS